MNKSLQLYGYISLNQHMCMYLQRSLAGYNLSIGSQRVRHDRVTKHIHLTMCVSIYLQIHTLSTGSSSLETPDEYKVGGGGSFQRTRFTLRSVSV